MLAICYRRAVYAIEYTRRAVKTLAAMPRNVRETVKRKIETLAHDPFGAPNVKQLAGGQGHRLRVGDWRVIYEVDLGRVVVHVLKIGPRGGVYE